jgi:hypothetical protein
MTMGNANANENRNKFYNVTAVNYCNTRNIK